MVKPTPRNTFAFLTSASGALGASVASANAKISPTKKTGSTVPSTPQSGVKRGRSAKDVDGHDVDDEEEHTPAKRAKSASAKKSVAGKATGQIKSEPIVDAEDEFIIT